MNTEMKPVSSSQISAVGYRPDAKQLLVQFSRGSCYVYDNVPQEVHDDLIAAESIGKFFGQHIKSNAAKYPFSKLEEGK